MAQSAVSTGRRAIRTPTGVFSVIQKNRFHRSNIYSGAPMPFMQRITWSGVAMHAGVLPGLSGLARLHPPAAQFRRRAVGHDQDGRARGRGARGCGRRRAGQPAPAGADADAGARTERSPTRAKPELVSMALGGPRTEGVGRVTSGHAAPAQSAGTARELPRPDCRCSARQGKAAKEAAEAVGRQGGRGQQGHRWPAQGRAGAGRGAQTKRDAAVKAVEAAKTPEAAERGQGCRRGRRGQRWRKPARPARRRARWRPRRRPRRSPRPRSGLGRRERQSEPPRRPEGRRARHRADLDLRQQEDRPRLHPPGLGADPRGRRHLQGARRCRSAPTSMWPWSRRGRQEPCAGCR